MRKFIDEIPDMRRRLPGVLPAPRHRVQSDLVDNFFLEMYQSAAEPLPTDTVKARSGTVDDSIALDEDPWLAAGASVQAEQEALMGENVDKWNPDFPVVNEAPLAVQARDFTVVGLPVRWLNHSNVRELYWLFLATWEVQAAHQLREDLGLPQGHDDLAAPAFRTFQRRCAQVWRRYLRFRKSSQHAQCTTCWRLQEAMACRGAAKEERLAAAAALRRHLRDQYLDRCIYWSLRWSNRQDMDVLTIIIDSMDKAKFAWPRWDFKRAPKEVEHLNRPRLVLTAALAHGWSTTLYWADESVTHGADAFVEVLIRTVEGVFQECKRAGRRFPNHLVVVSDNTVAQAKNSGVTTFLAFLVARKKFHTANLMFLRVGHTHEDVGPPVLFDLNDLSSQIHVQS